MLTAFSNTFDTFILIAKPSASVTLFVKGVGLIVKPIKSGVACGMAIFYENFHVRWLCKCILNIRENLGEQNGLEFF